MEFNENRVDRYEENPVLLPQEIYTQQPNYVALGYICIAYFQQSDRCVSNLSFLLYSLHLAWQFALMRSF